MTKHLKIFISSTFQDMQEEREILLKETFLELKKIAKKRDVEITEIDLRTGITKEQEESGQIVKICLDEIERCADSPIFFLGMLGNRYGWDEWHLHTDKETLDNPQYSWVKEHIGKSVTELEIVAAIERDKNANKAFFYFKENTSNDDKKLIELKNRLIEKSKTNNNLYVTHYKDTVDFKKKTIDSFTQVLDELYPKDKKLSEIEKLSSIHQVFAKSRQKIYIPHAKNEMILNEFIASNQDRLLLYGESGYGKSALIANYFEKLKVKESHFVITHYIGGAGESSNDLFQMLRRVMLEIKEEFNLTDELPSEPQKVMDEFTVWLHKVERPTIIVFDGYNQIEDEMKEKFFYYVPDKLNNIKLIITSIRDDYDIANKHKIEALEKEEKKALITNYLKVYGKTVDSKTKEQIAIHPQTDNTLFLKTLLDEIRLLGNFENLQKDISNYLSAKNVVELFLKIFMRLEKDYRENLTREVLSLLYVSRDGLSEDNLMEIINQNSTKKLTRLEFSPLFLAIEEHLIDRGGLYGFFHGFIVEAVKKRYLYSDKLIDAERRKIADYFEGREIDNQMVRELPFQLFDLKDINGMNVFLSDIFVFKYILEFYEIELMKYLYFLSSHNITTLISYITNLYLQEKDDKELLLLGKFLFRVHIKEFDNANTLLLEALKIRESKYVENSSEVIEVYDLIADFYRVIGNHSKSLSFYEKSLSIKEFLYKNDDAFLATSYHNFAIYFRQTGNYKKSLNYNQKAIELREKYFGEDYPDTTSSYLNIALVYKVLGNYEKAHYFNFKSLNIREKILVKNHPFLATNYTNIATLFLTEKKYCRSLQFFRKSLNLKKSIHGIKHPSLAYSYNGLCQFFTMIGKFKKSIFYGEKALNLNILFFTEEHINTGIIYSNLAKSYEKEGLNEKALEGYRKSLKILQKNIQKETPTIKSIKKRINILKDMDFKG